MEAITADPPSRGAKIVAVSAFLVFASLIASAPVYEPDAITYHAVTAQRWAQHSGSAPLLYGPGVGLPVSANYPPLFPASIAFLLTLTGSQADMLYKVLAPVQGAPAYTLTP